jgi:hypothetical protein
MGNIRHGFLFLLIMLIAPVFIFRSIDVELGKREAIEYVKEVAVDSDQLPLMEISQSSRVQKNDYE